MAALSRGWKETEKDMKNVTNTQFDWLESYTVSLNNKSNQ